MSNANRELDDFRAETRDWLEANCPTSMRTRMVAGEEVNGGRKKRSTNPESHLWLERMAERGWTAPTWPAEYGGAGLDKAYFLVLLEELARIHARPPLVGMGITMLGPTLLEYGTEEQKRRHLPKIAAGEVAWCQGYSEPGAGSDLASLKTRAVDEGDRYRVTGSKIWTSGAGHADWMFCLVRTDPDVPKHEGISFVLFSMDSPGVSTQPIKLLNGTSPFYQTFLDDVEVPKTDLVQRENHGWAVAKRLLQHERSGLAQLASAGQGGVMERISPSLPLPDLAREYAGEVTLPHWIRHGIAGNDMRMRALALTQLRAVAESEASTPGAATSIFKYVEAEAVKRQLELQLELRGTRAFGWEGTEVTEEEQRMCRLWLESKAISIAGGSNEVQLNVIAKRVLGLPD